MNTNAKATFDGIHIAFRERLLESKTQDEKFLREVSNVAATLSAPLGNEKIETTISRDGKRVTEVVEIGKRIAQFKKVIEKDEAKLKEYWEQWEELQNDYLELGIEVFGPEPFGEDAIGVNVSEKAYKREIELVDLENNARFEEIEEEIENIGVSMRQKMKTSEKVSQILPTTFESADDF